MESFNFIKKVNLFSNRLEIESVRAKEREKARGLHKFPRDRGFCSRQGDIGDRG